MRVQVTLFGCDRCGAESEPADYYDGPEGWTYDNGDARDLCADCSAIERPVSA